MKTIVFVILFVASGIVTSAQNKDLPSPAANLQTLTNGSYVIPMDNTLQTDNIIGSGNFNLNSYGLIVHLLNNNVKVKWVIKAGKSKDGIDFTGTAEQFKPVNIPVGVSRNFIAGPFAIFAADTAGVAALIDGFYSVNSLTGNNRPKVFRLSANVLNVDIRYDLSGFKPKGAILTDGGKQAIHVNFMNLCKIPSSNYITASAPDLLTKCFTFASEPHNTVTGPTTDANISAIKRFVQYGGNFLAECMAIENYENNPLGRFQTSNGITITNAAVGTSLTYPNPDLSFSQFEGSFNGSLKGSCMNWEITTGVQTNNDHHHATGTGLNSGKIAASVSKLKSGTGGLVFYLGNHDFALSDGLAAYNGIRMYMNAFLTPVSIANNCTIGVKYMDPLAVKLTSFSAVLNNTNADLTWTTATEVNASHFVVEMSTDGTNYSEAGTVFATGNSTSSNNYIFSDNVSTVKSGVIYYRLRSVDIYGKSEISEIRILRIGKQTENSTSILIFPNPVNDEVRITVPGNWQNKKILYMLFNANGQIAKRIEIIASSQTETVNVSSLAKGFYIMKVTCAGETAQQKIIKN